ncbi:hypothetical protein GGI06_000309 [Coemansia sp. S85]|nr:hypothetical protein GGI06_000309 [Coemansia sp. S85]
MVGCQQPQRKVPCHIRQVVVRWRILKPQNTEVAHPHQKLWRAVRQTARPEQQKPQLVPRPIPQYFRYQHPLRRQRCRRLWRRQVRVAHRPYRRKQLRHVDNQKRKLVRHKGAHKYHKRNRRYQWPNWDLDKPWLQSPILAYRLQHVVPTPVLPRALESP